RKPWVTPSTKRTETGAAEAGRNHSRTVTRTSEQSGAALGNDLTVKQEMCFTTGVFLHCAMAGCGVSSSQLRFEMPLLPFSQSRQTRRQIVSALPNSTNIII